MRKIESREYKVMLDHRLFADRTAAVSEFRDELGRLAETIGIQIKKHFGRPEKRSVAFFDTPDATLYHNDLILRQRENEWTLKCRSADRYIASGSDLKARKAMEKFEEDIATPFRPRFSHSSSLSSDSEPPKTLEQATALFPVVGTLQRDGMRCPGKTPLRVVGRAFERVYKGPIVQFQKERATLAVILWSDGPKGRPLVAEFSFRYKDKDEEFSSAVAGIAKRFFEAVQRLDWCRPDSLTKTQFVYAAKAI